MVYVNEFGFLERSSRGGKRNPTGVGTVRDWWLIKEGKSGLGVVSLSKNLYTPKDLVGRRIRLKVEVVQDG